MQGVGTGVLVSLAGALLQANVGTLQDLVDSWLDSGNGRIYIDLSGITQIDIHGAAAIEGIRQQVFAHVVRTSAALECLTELVGDDYT